MLKVEVSPNKDYVAFLATSDAVNIEPFQSLLRSGYDINSNKWWLVDTRTKQISLVKTGAEDLRWLDSSHYASSSGLEMFKSETGSDNATSLYKAEAPIQFFEALNNHIYVSEQNRQITLLKPDGSRKKVYDYGTGLIINPKNPDCFYYQTSSDRTDEVTNRLIGCSKKPIDIQNTLLSKNFSENGKYFFYLSTDEEGNLKRGYLDTSTMRTGEWDAETSTESEDIGIISVKSLNDSILRIGNRYYGQKSKEAKLIDGTTSYKAGSISIDLYDEDQTVTASKYGGFTEEDKSSVLNILEEKGYDTNLLVIKFSVLDGEDDRWS